MHVNTGKLVIWSNIVDEPNFDKALLLGNIKMTDKSIDNFYDKDLFLDLLAIIKLVDPKQFDTYGTINNEGDFIKLDDICNFINLNSENEPYELLGI